MESDDFFALQLRQAEMSSWPSLPNCAARFIRHQRAALGDIFGPTRIPTARSAAPKRFMFYRRWHPLLRNAAAQFGPQSSTGAIAPEKFFCRKPATTNVITVPVDEENNSNWQILSATNWRLGVAPKARALTDMNASGTWASFGRPRLNLI